MYPLYSRLEFMPDTTPYFSDQLPKQFLNVLDRHVSTKGGIFPSVLSSPSHRIAICLISAITPGFVSLARLDRGPPISRKGEDSNISLLIRSPISSKILA